VPARRGASPRLVPKGHARAAVRHACDVAVADRDYLLRLTPDRALETLDEAAEWVLERGLVTLMPASSLPSLFVACHEEPYKKDGRGFASWPRTKWWWGGALEERGLLYTKLLRGTGVFLSGEVAALADPLCREELARAEAGEFGEEAVRLVAHLAEAGPSLAEELMEELGIARASFRPLRRRLEAVGAVVAKGVRMDASSGGHRHTSELNRWDQLYPTPSLHGGLPDLVAAGVRAAVVAPEHEVRTWFSWKADAALIERLVEEGRLLRPHPRLLAFS